MIGAFLPFVGYAPDADPTTPGVLTECSNLVPSIRGMGSAPVPISIGTGVAIPADCKGAAALRDTQAAIRVLSATAAGIYELVGSAWVNQSRPGGYSLAADSYWSIAQFGNAALFTSLSAPLQASTGGAFADVASAPTAKVVVAAHNFVLLFNTFDSTNGAQSDRWACSAFQNHADWAPSVTTQATTGRIVTGGGGFTAAAMVGQQVAAFKERSMFLGTYVGSPVVWQFDPIPGEIGCVGQSAVADIGGALFFASHDNFWIFDGTRPASIADGQVRQWWADNCSSAYRHRTIVLPDRPNDRVWVFFVSANSTSGMTDTALVYHLGRKRWGKASFGAQAALLYHSPGITMDSLVGSFDDLSNASFDSPLWGPGWMTPAIVNKDKVLCMLAGGAEESSLTTGDIGDDEAVSMLRQARIRFLKEPTKAIAYGSYRMGEGKTLDSTPSIGKNDNGFDLRQSGRWHRVRFDFFGETELTGASYDLARAGVR